MQKERNLSFDIAKGIVIILMVLGHSGCPNYLNHFIYLFHIPCFFLVSGCLLNERHFSNKKNFVKRKIKGLYKPFIKWSLIFLLLHNVFTYLHLYEQCYHFADFKFKTFQILTMTGTEQLLGGFWFLKELLYASVIGFFTIYAVERFNLIKEKWMLLIIPIVFILLAYLISIASFKIPTIGSRTLMACSYYTLGYVMRITKFKFPLWSLIPLTLLLFPIPFFFHGNMDVVGTDIFIYYSSSLLGCGIILCISQILSKSRHTTKTLSQIGRATLYILIFHFISLKLISFIIITINHWPIEKLTSFPILDINSTFLWMVYGTAGVIIWKLKNKFEERRS